jgi:hypothetical protein
MNKILSEAQLNAFIKTVCSEVPSTLHGEAENHVYSCYEEAAAALSNASLRFPAIIIGAFDGRIASKGDTNIDVKNISFAVLMAAEKENWAVRIEKRDQALLIAMEIVERIYQYHHTQEYLQVMELGTARYFQVSSKLDSSVGYSVSFDGGSLRSFKNEF